MYRLYQLLYNNHRLAKLLYNESRGSWSLHCLQVVVVLLLLANGNSNTHGARLVHLIITMIKWIRASRLSIKNSLSDTDAEIFRDDSEKSHQGAAELPVEHPRPAPVHLQNLCVHLKKRMYVSIKRISGAPPRIPYARK